MPQTHRDLHAAPRAQPTLTYLPLSQARQRLPFSHDTHTHKDTIDDTRQSARNTKGDTTSTVEGVRIRAGSGYAIHATPGWAGGKRTYTRERGSEGSDATSERSSQVHGATGLSNTPERVPPEEHPQGRNEPATTPPLARRSLAARSPSALARRSPLNARN